MFFNPDHTITDSVIIVYGYKSKCHSQPWSHPLKNVEFRDGWDRGWVMAFPLVSFFEGRSMTGHPLIFQENFLLLVCELF